MIRTWGRRQARQRTDDSVARYRRQSEQLLASLGMPTTFTFTQLHDLVERHRGRQVNLIPRDLPALAPHGLWIAGEYTGYVFYATGASPVRQQLIIGHEYGHMLFDDAATPADLRQMAALLMPSVDPTGPASVLARSGYDAPVEQRAEIFGTVAVLHAQPWSELPICDPVDPAVSARLIATLEGRADT